MFLIEDLTMSEATYHVKYDVQAQKSTDFIVGDYFRRSPPAPCPLQALRV